MESKKDTGIQFHCQVRLAEGTREIHKFSCFIHLTINPSEIGVICTNLSFKSANF